MLLRFAPQLGFAALIALTALGTALTIQSSRLDTAKSALAAKTAAHARDIANVRAAQERANADWQAQLGRLAAEQRRQSDEADRNAAADAHLYRDRVLHIPGIAATGRATANASLPGTALPPRTDGSGADTLLLARADALICAENSARLVAAHDWVRGLIASWPPASE